MDMWLVFPDADPAHQILSAREPHEWRRPTGQPRASWLQQVDWILKEMGMGQNLPGGWPDGGSWSTGGKWTQRRAAPAHAPIPDLTGTCVAYLSNNMVQELSLWTMLLLLTGPFKQGAFLFMSMLMS